MRILYVISVAFSILGQPLWSQDTEETLCFEAPHDRLCPAYPHDVPDFSVFFEYMVISAGAQDPFDSHAWQSFVALNWSDVGGGAAQVSWRDFDRRDTVLGLIREDACEGSHARSDVVVTDFEQSDGHALIDRNGNYILYETRLNSVARDYVLQENLHRLSGQRATKVDFPRGKNAEAPAPVLMKTAWTVLEADQDDFITAMGTVSVAADHSQNGAPMCLALRLGLVGMHIVTKVASGNGDEWIWATFEHRNNAPVAADARDVNAIYGNALFPEGCIPPDTVTRAHHLFDETRGGPANAPPAAQPFWSASKPYAVDANGSRLPTSQVVRCWEIFAPTQQTNARWQQALKGTPLENYMLISAQWRGANISPYIEHGELPRFLSNTTMETYLQTERSGTCLGCHADATTAVGTPSDFTFILDEVRQ